MYEDEWDDLSTDPFGRPSIRETWRDRLPAGYSLWDVREGGETL